MDHPTDVNNLTQWQSLGANISKELRFGPAFNSPIVIPEGVQIASLDDGFNQSIVLPKSMRQVRLGHMFDQLIELPEGLETIRLGDAFNQPIILPKSIQKAWFGDAFNQHVELQNNIQDIGFGDAFNQHVVLPDTLKEISFGSQFNKPIVLPKGVKRVFFCKSGCFNQSLAPLPDSLIELELNMKNYDHDLGMIRNKLLKINGRRVYYTDTTDNILTLLVAYNLQVDKPFTIRLLACLDTLLTTNPPVGFSKNSFFDQVSSLSSKNVREAILRSSYFMRDQNISYFCSTRIQDIKAGDQEVAKAMEELHSRGYCRCTHYPIFANTSAILNALESGYWNEGSSIYKRYCDDMKKVIDVGGGNIDCGTEHGLASVADFNSSIRQYLGIDSDNLSNLQYTYTEIFLEELLRTDMHKKFQNAARRPYIIYPGTYLYRNMKVNTYTTSIPDCSAAFFSTSPELASGFGSYEFTFRVKEPLYLLDLAPGGFSTVRTRLDAEKYPDASSFYGGRSKFFGYEKQSLQRLEMKMALITRLYKLDGWFAVCGTDGFNLPLNPFDPHILQLNDGMYMAPEVTITSAGILKTKLSQLPVRPPPARPPTILDETKEMAEEETEMEDTGDEEEDRYSVYSDDESGAEEERGRRHSIHLGRRRRSSYSDSMVHGQTKVPRL
jgi:hypothetical protein